MAKYTLATTLLLAGSFLAAAAKDENQKLRGVQSRRGLYAPVNPVVPPPTPNPTDGWRHDGFDRIDTPAPTDGWSGGYEPLPAPLRNDWSDDGWDDDRYPAPVNPMYVVNVSGKSNKGYNQGYGYNVVNVTGKGGKSGSVSGSYVSKSNKIYGYNGVSGKGGKSGSVSEIYVSGGSSKSNKGYGYTVVNVTGKGGKSGSVSGLYVSGGSSKSNKVYGINVSGGSSKSGKGYSAISTVGKSGKGSGVYVNVMGGKSIKGFYIDGSSKSSKGTPVNPIEPIDKWGHDGYVDPIVRGKVWDDDGHVTPLVTPKPTPRPTWKGDAHTPAPTTCEERKWHPNADYTKCTNDGNFDSDSEYNYNTLAMCCMSVFGTLSCPFDNICVEFISPAPSPAPTSCEEREFYAIKNEDQLYCSNGYDVPTGWAGSEYNFDTLQACCEAEFGKMACFYEDVCSTLPPSPSPVTPAPTPCGDQVFYFNGNFCSNEFVIVGAPAYASLSACCNLNFGIGSFINGECMYVDECNPNPTPKPSMKPTKKPTPAPVTPAPTPCGDQVFYFNGNSKVCSNEFVIAGAPAYASLFACCNLNFGIGSFMNGSCQYVDECNPNPTPRPSMKPTKKPTPAPIEVTQTPEPTLSPVTPSPTPCEAQVFFYDGNLCSNDFYIADAPAYNTAVACCNQNFGMGSFKQGKCNYIDTCNTLPPSPSPITPEPTDSPITPAPTPCDDRVFFFDGNSCTNDIFIADAPEFMSLKKCCNFNFGLGSLKDRSCIYIDICNTLPPSPSPTFISTPGSTPTVSKETTGPPTMGSGRDDEENVSSVVTCNEITGGYPQVCVKVCTTIKSIFKGDMLMDETAQTTEEECDN